MSLFKKEIPEQQAAREAAEARNAASQAALERGHVPAARFAPTTLGQKNNPYRARPRRVPVSPPRASAEAPACMPGEEAPPVPLLLLSLIDKTLQ